LVGRTCAYPSISPRSHILRTLYLQRVAGGNTIYAGEGPTGRLQALSFGRFATIWPCEAVPCASSVTNSQPSSPSLFRRLTSSFELWNGSQWYSHFCMIIPPSASSPTAAAALRPTSERSSGVIFDMRPSRHGARVELQRGFFALPFNSICPLTPS